MQQNHNTELVEPSFFVIKLPIKFLIINLFVFQTIFYICTATLVSVAEQQNLFSFEGLEKFTFDMWFVVILLSVGLLGYAKLKQQKECLLMLVLVYPALVMVLSLIRDASSIIVIVLSGVIAFLICRYNFQKLSAKYLEEAANNRKGY